MVTFSTLFMNSIYPDNELRVLGNEMTFNLDEKNRVPVLDCKMMKFQVSFITLRVWDTNKT